MREDESVISLNFRDRLLRNYINEILRSNFFFSIKSHNLVCDFISSAVCDFISRGGGVAAEEHKLVLFSLW